jgi:hypothetical protein
MGLGSSPTRLVSLCGQKVWLQGELGVCVDKDHLKARREVPGETKCADTFISDFQPPEL